jgi:hypothetical protein
MTQQPSAPQPDQQFVIEALQEELTRVNENRLYLLASLRQMGSEAKAEIGRLDGIMAAAASQISDPEDRAKISEFMRGKINERFGPADSQAPQPPDAPQDHEEPAEPQAG